jgi:polyphosphate kinase 2 (PPK2 family)
MTPNRTSADKSKLKRTIYEKELRKLQVELCRLQDWVKHKGLRVIIVFEGRDAAGKGGTIKAITERVSPRVFRVVALPAPSSREKTQMYFQRYVPHFPAAGEIIIFDRSWYNRAGVEYVMGTEEDHRQFLIVCPGVEQYIVDGGIVLIKFWLEVGKEEGQIRRSSWSETNEFRRREILTQSDYAVWTNRSPGKRHVSLTYRLLRTASG